MTVGGLVNHAIVSFTGNLVADPDPRQLPSGVRVTNLRVASTERRFDKHNNQWYDGSTTFFNVTCWKGLGDRVAGNLHKGDPVFVSGRLLERGYDKKDGSGRVNYWEVEASVIGPDLSKTNVEVLRQRRADVAAESTPAQSGEPASDADVDPWTTPLEERAEPAA
jgi:single-strand DNA-binding protein